MVTPNIWQRGSFYGSFEDIQLAVSEGLPVQPTLSTKISTPSRGFGPFEDVFSFQLTLLQTPFPVEQLCKHWAQHSLQHWSGSCVLESCRTSSLKAISNVRNEIYLTLCSTPRNTTCDPPFFIVRWAFSQAYICRTVLRQPWWQLREGYEVNGDERLARDQYRRADG
ncbi:hypothetical protein BJV74DRAFT_177192 [Russula compacta]|nr:hypothetical protein BJV74DRAFT_177192 [Russula compacta]